MVQFEAAPPVLVDTVAAVASVHAEQTAGKLALPPVSIKSSASAKKTPAAGKPALAPVSIKSSPSTKKAGLCLPAGQGVQADDPPQT